MSKISKYSFWVFTLFSLSIATNSCNNVEKEVTIELKDNKSNSPTKLLRHVVLFEFKENATAEIVDKIEKEFSALPEKISEIHSYEWGINNSPEGLNNGLTHCFFVTFLSEEDRAKYLPHPAHQKFVDFIGPYVKSVTVVDYWTD